MPYPGTPRSRPGRGWHLRHRTGLFPSARTRNLFRFAPQSTSAKPKIQCLHIAESTYQAQDLEKPRRIIILNRSLEAFGTEKTLFNTVFIRQSVTFALSALCWARYVVTDDGDGWLYAPTAVVIHVRWTMIHLTWTIGTEVWRRGMRRASVIRHHHPSPRIRLIVCCLRGCDGCDGFRIHIFVRLTADLEFSRV